MTPEDLLQAGFTATSDQFNAALDAHIAALLDNAKASGVIGVGALTAAMVIIGKQTEAAMVRALERWMKEAHG